MLEVGRGGREKEILIQQRDLIQQLGLSQTSTAAEAKWRVSALAEDLDILDALIALHETLQRRETERMHESARRREEHKQLQAAAEQGPAPEGDVGRDFGIARVERASWPCKVWTSWSDPRRVRT